MKVSCTVQCYINLEWNAIPQSLNIWPYKSGLLLFSLAVWYLGYYTVMFKETEFCNRFIITSTMMTQHIFHKPEQLKSPGRITGSMAPLPPLSHGHSPALFRSLWYVYTVLAWEFGVLSAYFLDIWTLENLQSRNKCSLLSVPLCIYGHILQILM